MCRTTKSFFLFLAISLYARTIAWEGVDAVSGESVEIESGNLVREGETIDMHDSGGNKSMDISSINRMGTSVEIQGTDRETGESRTLEMNDDSTLNTFRDTTISDMFSNLDSETDIEGNAIESDILSNESEISSEDETKD